MADGLATDDGDRRWRTAERLLGDVRDDVESRAFAPALAGAVLVVAAGLLDWLAGDGRAEHFPTGTDWAVLGIGLAGLLLLAAGLVRSFGFAFRRARGAGLGRLRSTGAAFRYLARFAFRWIP